MTITKALLPSALLPLIVLGTSAQGAVLASTTFDGRTLTTTAVASDTASGLNWSLDGLGDPGNMAARNASGAGQVIFDGAGKIVKDAFVPGLNTGNGNTFWTTSINLTVAVGSTVTLTDVTFDYLAVNGGQDLNVARRSDFTVTLFNPSAVAVDSVTVADVVSGSTVVPQIAPVAATFAAPIALTAPGTYTLEIKGGDFAGTDETGNHTGIDNLSINGIVTIVPEPSTFLLTGFGLVPLWLRRRR